MPTTCPTPAEIRYGLDRITEDGPQAEITVALAQLAQQEPLQSGMKRMMSSLPPQLTGAMSATFLYGLYLGLHIGEGRWMDRTR